MKLNHIAVAVVATLALGGCVNQMQASQSMLHQKQLSICTEGDDYSGTKSNYAGFLQAAEECGGVQTIEREMLADKRLRRLNSEGSYRDYLFLGNGNGTLIHEENIDVAVPFTWRIDNDNVLQVEFGSGWRWSAAVTEQDEAFLFAKVFEYPQSNKESYLWGTVFEVVE